MALLSISQMPILSRSYVHLPRRSLGQSSRNASAKIGRPSTIQNRRLHLRYLHLRPASQIMAIKPAPCLLYTSTRCRTQSPLRTMIVQDTSETVPPYARSRRRLPRSGHMFARDALSDATRSQSRVNLLPSRRTAVSGLQFEYATDD
jgi:hypothetical protein